MFNNEIYEEKKKKIDFHSLCCNEGQTYDEGINFDSARKVVEYDRLCKCQALNLKSEEAVQSYDTKDSINGKVTTCVLNCERETVGHTSIILKGSNDEEVKMCLSKI